MYATQSFIVIVEMISDQCIIHYYNITTFLKTKVLGLHTPCAICVDQLCCNKYWPLETVTTPVSIIIMTIYYTL